MLTGASTYTGPTIVNAGSLSIPETSATNDIQVATGAALTITGSTGATIGGVTPITGLTVGSSPGTGTATLSFANFSSGGSALIQASDFVPQGTVGATPAPGDSPTGGVVISLVGGTFTGPGTFPLIWITDYEELGGDGFNALSLGSLPRNIEAYLDNTDPTAVDLVVTSYKPTVWVGDESAVWDINTTENWAIDSVKDAYIDSDVTLFDASAAGVGPVSVTLGTTVAPSGMTVDGVRDYAITGAGVIGGTTGMIKNGAATLTLGTNNTFAGAVAVNAGTVKLGHANALGGVISGTTVASGAVLDLNGVGMAAEPLSLGGSGIGGTGVLLNSNTATTASTAGPIVMTSATTIGGAGGLTLSGAVSQGANLLTLANTGTATLALSGAMTGSGGLAVGGTGTTTVSGPMTFTGAAGLAVTNTGTTTISGATNLTGSTGNVTVGGTGTTIFSGAVSGPASLTKSDAGILTLSARQFHTGNTVINGGTVDCTGGGGADGTLTGTVTVNSGASLRLSTGDATGYALGTNRMTAINLLGGNLHVNTTSNQTLGAAALTVQGGSLTGVAGSNLDFYNDNNALPGRSSFTTLASATTSVVSGTTIKMRQNDGVIFNIADGAAAVDLDIQSNLRSDAFTNNQLVKNGLGTMRISGLSTYAHPTVINAGAMIVPSAQSSTAYTLADDTSLSITGVLGSSLTTGAMTIGTAGATTLNVATFNGQTLAANAPVRVTGTLTLEGTPTLNLSGYFPAAGTYPVVSYGTLAGIADFTLGTLPRNVVATLDLNMGTNTYDLNVSSVNPLYWDGTVDGNWNLATQNWIYQSAAASFQQTDVVVFNDDATGTTDVILGGQMAPASVLVNNTTKNYSITGAGTNGITGSCLLIKNGTGTLTLAAANTFTGGTNVNAGTLQLGDGTIDGTLAGNIVNNASLVANTAVSQTLAGTVSGTGGLTKIGAGTFALTTAPTYTGSTTVSAGTLQVPALTSTSSITNNSTLVFNRTDSAESNPAGVITGTGNVAYTGPAVATSTLGQYLVDDVNTYGGTTTVTNARMNLTNLAGINSGAVTINNGGQILVNAGQVTFNNALTINGIGWPEAAGNLGALRLQSGPTIATPIALGSTSRISFYGSYGWITGAITGNGDLELAANSKTDTLHLTGTSVNSYTGKTTIISGSTFLNKIGTPAFFTNVQMGGGTTAQPNLRMLASNQFGSGVELIPGNTSGNWARFEMQGTNQTLAGISTGNLTTQGGTIIQNRSLDDSASNWGTATLTLNGSGNYVFNGYLRDTDGAASATNMLAITKTGTGTQTLAGNQLSFSGPITVNQGRLIMAASASTATTAITIASGAVYEVNPTATNFGNNNCSFSGAGTYIKSGSLVWDMAYNNSAVKTIAFSSGALIDVQGGTLRLGYGGNNNWTNNKADMTVVSGAFFDTWDCANVVVDALNGAGTVTRGVAYPAAGSGNGSVTVGADNGSGSFSGVITQDFTKTGIQSLVKVGTGTQTLSGVNTYTGTTTINGGTLALSGSGSINGSTAVTIASGAVLDVSATTFGEFTQATGKTLTGGRTSGSGNDIVGGFATGGTLNVAGSAIPGTLTVSGDLTLDGGGNLQLDLSGSASSGNDQIVSGGALNLTDAGVTTVTPTFTGAPVFGTAYPIITFTGTAPVGTGSFTASLPSGSGITGATFDTTTEPGKVLMTLAGETTNLVWSGTSGQVWSTDPLNTYWNGPATPTKFRNLDSVQFLDIAATAAMTVNIGNTGNLTPIPASILVNNTSTNYTFATTAAGAIAGGATLTKTGTGLLQISNANTFSGGILVSQGSLQTGNNSAAGTGAITLGDAGTGSNNISWKWNGSGQPSNPVVVSALGTGTVTIGSYSTGTSTIHSGPMTLDRAVTLSDASGDRTSFTGKISGNVGSITVTGTRITLDNPANDFVGNVTVNSGSVLQLSGVGGSLPDATNLTVAGTLKLNTSSTNETIAGLSGAGTVQNHESVNGTPTLTVGYGNATGYAFTGPINNGSGTLSFAKIGTGTQTLGGVGGFTGTTRVFGGTLALTNSSALAGSTLVWDNEGGALDLGSLTAVSIGALQGAQNFSMLNASSTPVALTLGNGNASTSYTGALLGGTTLTKTGTGHQILGGTTSNTYTGLTSLVNGRLGLEKNGAIAIPGSITMTNNEGVHLFTLADNQFGPGSVLTMSGGTGNSRLEMLGTTQTFAGLVNDGTGRGVVQGREQVGQLVVSPLSTLILDVPALATPSFNGYLRSTGTTVKVIKNGPGKQILSRGGADRLIYTGGTIVNAGILEFGAGNSTDQLTTGGFTINAGGTMQSVAATNVFGGVTMNGGTLAGVGLGQAEWGHFVMGSNVTTGGTQRSLISADVRVGSAADRTFTVNPTGDASGVDLEITGKIGHTNNQNWGYLTKAGAGTMRFNGSTYNGSTTNNASDIGRITVNAGKVVFKDYMALMANGGLIINTGGTVDADMGTGVDYTYASSMTGTTGVFNKIGAGKLTRTGGGAFGGNINVNDGKLIAKAAGALGATSNTRLITVAAGKTLEFHAANVFGNHGTTAAPIVVEAGGVITNADPAATGKINNGLGALTLNSATLTATVGNGISTIDPGRPGEGYGAWGLNGTVTSTGTSTISVGSVSGYGDRVLLSNQVAGTTMNVVDGTLTVSAPLQGSDPGVGGLTKTGAGTLVLSGVNLYTANTVVGTGTLNLAGSGQLLFVLGSVSGTSNSVSGAGTATFNGSFKINTTAANALETGTWTLVDVNTLTESFGGTFSVVDFTDQGDGTWTKIDGDKMWTFDESTGELTLGANPDPFLAWADSYGLEGGDALKGADPDGDGFINLLEFATASNPTQGGSGPRVYPLMHVIGGDNALTYTVAVRKEAVFAAAANPDQKKQTGTKDLVKYTIEASDDLGATWNVVEVTEVTGTTATTIQSALGSKLTAPALGADWEWHTFRTDDGAEVDPKDFVRLKVEEAAAP